MLPLGAQDHSTSGRFTQACLQPLLTPRHPWPERCVGHGLQGKEPGSTIVSLNTACLCLPPTVSQCMLGDVASEAWLAQGYLIDSGSILPCKRHSACPHRLH